jgi:hypothetical protein
VSGVRIPPRSQPVLEVFLGAMEQIIIPEGIFYLFLTSKQEVLKKYRSPQVGFEPTTNRLTADRSTTELLRNNVESSILYTFKDFCSLNRSIMQEPLKNKKPKGFFGTLGTLRTLYPLFYRKKVTIAIPFASPENVSETKGGGQPSP